VRLAGWGNYPTLDCRTVELPRGPEALVQLAAEASLIARGNGRSYGDAALSRAATILMGRRDRFLAFEPTTGLLTCESGVLLADVLDVFVPRGWFPPVTPGTKFVTIGGMIAADVHGKNHHQAGSFCRHVTELELLRGDGEIVRCSREVEPALFEATCGGMGLTGIILSASFRMLPIETAWIRQEQVRCPDLAATMDAFDASHAWTYSVAWIDTLARGRAAGRSVVFRGEHAKVDELPPARRPTPFGFRRRRAKRFPFFLPQFVLSRLTVSAFNAVLYQVWRSGAGLIDYDRFFYPLDAILEWNRMYGRKGFAQYQCVLPLERSRAGLPLLLDEIARAGWGSFLAVLKLLGEQDTGTLSFPMRGYTLALDFAVRPGLRELFARLDEIVAGHGGRLYLAKDAMMPPALLARTYAGLPAFRAIRAAHGAARFSSALAERLGL
jgi:FAD/FMN-containing dehydrogenase